MCTVGYVHLIVGGHSGRKATKLQRLRRPRMKLNVHESQISMKANKKSSELSIQESKVMVEGRTGTNRERHRWSTLCRNLEPGIALSRLSVHHPRIRCHGKVAVQRAMAKRERVHKSIGRWGHPYPQRTSPRLRLLTKGHRQYLV